MLRAWRHGRASAAAPGAAWVHHVEHPVLFGAEARSWWPRGLYDTDATAPRVTRPTQLGEQARGVVVTGARSAMAAPAELGVKSSRV